MKPLHPTACDFMVYKDYKIGLKFVLPTNIINFRITCSPVYYHITIYCYIFLEFIPSQFPYYIINKLLIIYLFTCCFRCSSKHFIHIELSEPKIIPLYLIMVSLMAFYCFVFIEFRRGIFNSFAFCINVVLLIYFFCNPQAGHKSLFSVNVSFTPQNIHHHLNHSACYVFILLNIYLRMIVFTLFVYRVNL